MTREEEIREAAKEFVFGDRTETSDFFDKVMIDSFYHGAKWAYEHPNLCEEEQVGMNELGMMWQKQALIKKACEWLENIDFASEYFYDGEGFFENAILVEEFKKAIEE